ncbi:MAG: DUF222 domain-containing protein [Actinomycetes bacterium]
MFEDGYGDGGAAAAGPRGVAGRLVDEIRDDQRLIAAAQARQLHRLASLAAACEREARRELAVGPSVPGQPCDEAVIASTAAGEVAVALGVSSWQAHELVELATRLARVLPDTLRAVEAGRLDLSRARLLAQETAVLDDAGARTVQAQLLSAAGTAPWDGPSPRAWRARVQRAVVRADPAAARRRREQALADRAVRAFPNGDGTGDLRARGMWEDVQMTEQVIRDLAQSGPSFGSDGQRLSIDQRCADAFFDVFQRIRDGSGLPAPSVRREREIGVVLHVDTLVGDGPAADDPGEVRGLGAPAPLDVWTARELARAEIARGSATCVLLTDTHGSLLRLIRLAAAPSGGWSREALVTAARAALRHQPPLQTDRYEPTVAIAEHVRARNPRCTSYDCPRSAHRADLDHDEPWPRGPTDVRNLHPKCRRHHELKTRGLVRTTLHPAGSVTSTLLSGVQVTTRPEPLPGHAPGEGYAPVPDENRRLVVCR